MSNITSDFKLGDLVLYKNNQLIAFNKPATLAVQRDKSEDKALIDLGEIYYKSKLHIIHRLDRPASGVVLFAKNKKALAALNEQFKNRTIAKTYLAVVKNLPNPSSGNLIHYLTKNNSGTKSIVMGDEKKGKKAELKYELLKSIDNYHLLKIELITGRFHQIRAQLAAIDNPIKGDVKYGFRRGNKDRSIHLHAWKLSFEHPVSKLTETITAPLPKDSIWDAFQL